MGKKYLIIFILAFAVVILFNTISIDNITYAEEIKSYNTWDNHEVKLIYGDYSLGSGRILQSFTVSIDNEFMHSLEEGSNFLKNFKDFFKLYGFEVNIQDDSVIATKEFDSLTEYYIYNNRDGYKKSSPSNNKEKRTFFFREITSKQKTIFYGIDGNNQFVDLLLLVFEFYGIGRENIAFGYNYGTPYQSVTSNAEIVYFDINSRTYVHEFQMDISSTNREIVLKQRIPNAINWYLLAILISIPFIVAPFIISIYLKRREIKRREYE